LGTSCRPAGPIDNIVQALLEQTKKVLTSDTPLTRGRSVNVAELALRDAIAEAGLLLLLELGEILRVL